MKRVFLISVLFLLPVMASCSVFDWANDKDLVVTTLDQVKEGSRGDLVVLPTEKIPEKYRESWKDEVVVVASEDSLKPDASFVPLSTEGEDWNSGTIGTLLAAVAKAGSTFFPPLAGLEALLLLLFRRKREHYKNAAKSVLPMNGSVDLKEGFKNVGRALGMVHSSEASKEVFEDEKLVEES